MGERPVGAWCGVDSASAVSRTAGPSIILFFFQAEDGIRDRCVTGVQTCALPICRSSAFQRREPSSSSMRLACEEGAPLSIRQPPWSGLDCARGRRARSERSEERRVGKECRSGWAVGDGGETGRCVVWCRLGVRRLSYGRSVDHSFFFSSRRRHTRSLCDWSSDVCSSDLPVERLPAKGTLELVDEIGMRGGGSALNTATALVRLGLRAGAAGKVGEIGRASCRERVSIWVGGGRWGRDRSVRGVVSTRRPPSLVRQVRRSFFFFFKQKTAYEIAV